MKTNHEPRVFANCFNSLASGLSFVRLGFACICLALLLLPACNKRQLLKKNELIEVHEARLFDVPFYIGAFDNVSLHDQDGTEQITYFARATSSEIRYFFCQEMERLGWLNVVEFTGPEQILVFKKPSSWSVVTIEKQSSNMVHVKIMLKRLNTQLDDAHGED
ncbi:MAG: hypothetical protein BWY54_00165 [Candidatus Dependentiae bacterium ADurb.Bin331]|nr:MAG: hypothetical protein BWY54_00165 [Candidatus Dependentiae bacterium ADurb.Bin331]